MADLRIKAILSEVDKVDSDGDIILPGAFDDAIKTVSDLLMLYMHKRGEIVGKWDNLRMDGKLFKADGVIFSGDDGYDRAKMAAKLIKAKLMKGVSIGFRPTEWKSVSIDDRPYGWDIEALDLKEASIVDVPANSSAEVTDIKQKMDKEKLKTVMMHKFFRADIEIEAVDDSDEIVSAIRDLLN